MPRILKMPKAPPRTESETPTPVRRHDKMEATSSISKTPPMAEIVFFPNAKEIITGVSEAQTDPQTRTRWLRLADEVLESDESRKKARRIRNYGCGLACETDIPPTNPSGRDIQSA